MSDSGRKLLIIDDDTIVRKSIVAYLEDSGFDVDEAGDGPMGLELFQQNSYDLILSDLRMPGMDGLKVLEYIHDISPEIPVIVVSGVGVMGDVVEALRLGASDYLMKPLVDMEMLVHSVKKSIERHDLLEQNRRYRDKLEQANRELREHLKVLERDHEAGRQVQTRLLPATPMRCGDHYHISHHIKPSLFLSGDFIDYGFMERRFLAFYLADVSGHGASSAFVTVWLKHLINHMVRDEGLFADQASFEAGTAMTLSRVNQELLSARINHHLTMFVGVIDTETNQLRYSVGGHLPMPAIVDGQGTRYLEGMGKPVGLFAGASWEVYSQSLEQVFNLVTFSDGVLEILPQKELTSKESFLLETVSKAEGDMDRLRELLAFDGVEEVPDDIAILTVGRRQ